MAVAATLRDRAATAGVWGKDTGLARLRTMQLVHFLPGHTETWLIAGSLRYRIIPREILSSRR
jgi:hypothetical protein